jgi:hypothetical protein
MSQDEHSSIWSRVPALIAELRQHLADKWSASQTANALSRIAGQRISRNAVIGKARRTGIAFESGNDGKYLRNKKKSRKSHPVPINIVREKVPSLELPDEQPKQADFIGLTILEVKSDQCKYPHGEKIPYLFCGAPVWGESSYCAHHHRICNTGYSTGFNKPGVSNELHGNQGGPLPLSAGRAG